MYHLDYWRKFFCMFLSFQYKKMVFPKFICKRHPLSQDPRWAKPELSQEMRVRIRIRPTGPAWPLSTRTSVDANAVTSALLGIHRNLTGISDWCATVVNLVGESLYSDQFWMFGMGTSYECWTGHHHRRCCTTVAKGDGGTGDGWNGVCDSNQLPQ